MAPQFLNLVLKRNTIGLLELPGTTGSLWSTWYNRHLWLRLIGSGRVVVQSAFEPVEDDGKTITSSSPSTQYRW